MTSDMPAPETLTLTDARDAIRNGRLTSEELVTACLRRIAETEPALHACVTVMADAALAQAREADAAIRAKAHTGPLHGLPLALKDIIATRGVLTTAGSRVLDDWIPDEDAAVVTRLTQAGAISLCKTNTHEFAFGTYTPPTRNPWNTERIPGGSSGGSAAALAANDCPGALGTDTGGSIRIPSACCGTTGLKPTYGLVSRTGIVPLSGSLDVAGPMARTVADCALLLDVLAGYDPSDPDSVDVPLLNYTAALSANRAPADAVRGARIGIPTSYFFSPIDREIEAAVRAAVDTFVSLGATVVELAMPAALEGFFDFYRGVQRPEAYTYHRDMGWLTTRADRYSPTVRANIEAGADISASDYIHAQQIRRAVTAEMLALMTQVDVLFTPTMAMPAPRADESDTPLRAGGEIVPGGTLRCTFPFNMTGQPALSLPCGFTSEGLPIGLQIAGARFGEATMLRLGHAYQRVTTWHTRQPQIPAQAS
ncbi:MAG TPA: amidase [Ktedonobacterales bacterium]|nr:amidase [Ktedonobacterales bacterium]